MTNRQLTWLLVPSIVGGLMGLMALLYLSIDSDANALRGASMECVHSDQCEGVQTDKIFAEPQNTLSNLAYLFAGLCIFIRALRPGFNERRVPAVMVGASFCFLAAMSAYYHATLNDIGAAGVFPQCISTGTKTPQVLDIVGVYLSLLSMICFGLDRLLRKRIAISPFNVLFILGAVVVALAAWLLPASGVSAENNPVMTGVSIWAMCAVWGVVAGLLIALGATPVVVWIAWGGMVLVNAVFSLLMRTTFRFDSELVFPVLVGILLAVTALNLFLPDGDRRPRFALGDILLMLSAFAVGIACRVLDGMSKSGGILEPHPLCKADAFFQAHACWHLMSALALLLTFDLIENSSAPEGVDASGASLLPTESSLVAWLARPGGVMGRSVSAFVFNLGFSLVVLGFCLVMLVNLSPASAGALLPLGTAVYLWAMTYVARGIPVGSRW